ncbi:PEPxxWA-CTERM sorting domain-containing protein [Sphingobium boeckii]|uniref:Subtilisin-like proprotein convertase family protein n=1 Tax=Sphingobium boeckii TaxID=1082345 RepID=A0A7W9AIH9_9SPHN|nr:PEPxxWA-CTERM sorting domain-containing protein [Sphingobium boeckii]MBB5686265.1 subtilisin-like proprotein convertase family protein [Sphingobium boeckii]
MMNKKTVFAAASLALASISAPASAAVLTFNGSGGAIWDYSTLTSTITVPDNFVVTDVNVILNGLSHSYWGDLVISLTHGAVSATLISQEGGSSNANGTFTFDDSAAKSAAQVNTGGGSFRPEVALTAFNGTNSTGAWVLKVADTAWLDTGNLASWSVQLTGNAVAPVPEPATWAMMIIGFGAVGGVMRRRAKVTVTYA